ncbi:MAG: hypothetical protein ACF8LK_01960 [Phycisphaerales bacterium JB041]
MATHPMTAVAGLVALAASTAAAQDTIYLATSGSTLYRAVQAEAAETFSLSDDITSLLRAPNGDILGISPSENGSGTFEIYRLLGALSSNPTLELVSDSLPNSYPGATYVGDTLYGFRNGSRNLVTYDIGSGVETEVGPAAPMQGPVGGAAYDRNTDTFYAVSRTDASLFSIDYRAGSGDPDATLIGSLGIGIFNMGLDYYEGSGSLYAAFEDTTNGQFVAGTVSTDTGLFMGDTILFDGALDGSVGFIVVPAPGVLAAFAAGGLVATRRRR